MNSNPTISVIVPVYNAADYLSECLRSIQSQDISDWECICVDDGSLDQSAEIVANFAAQDERFRLIRQSNAGPGGARNTGLSRATGDYFTFVDADDVLHPKCLEQLLLIAEQHKADLVVCNYSRFRFAINFSKTAHTLDRSRNKTDVCHAPLLPKMVDWRKFRVHPWGKLYQYSTHRDLRFPDLYGPEDAYASFDVYGASACTVFTSMCLYGYRIVETGLTRSMSKYRNYITGYADVAVHGEELLKKHGVSNVVRSRILRPYIMAIFGFISQMSSDANVSRQQKKELLAVGRAGLKDIRQRVADEYRTVPLVHLVNYCALSLHSLWLLILWQRAKTLFAPFKSRVLIQQAIKRPAGRRRR